MRVLWGVAGITSIGLGLAGTILPLVPTVPFILLAAFCFSRSSDRLHDWLVEHDLFGPMIRDWRDHGAIGLPAKQVATLSIISVFGLSLALELRPSLLLVQVIVLTLVLCFIWTRPTG